MYVSRVCLFMLRSTESNGVLLFHRLVCVWVCFVFEIDKLGQDKFGP